MKACEYETSRLVNGHYIKVRCGLDEHDDDQHYDTTFHIEFNQTPEPPPKASKDAGWWFLCL